jgi:hypothetical protein
MRHGLDEIRRSPQGMGRSARNDGPGDGSAVRLFAVLLKEVRQLRFAEGRQQRGCRASLRRIEPHVERAAVLKSKAAIPVGQLVGRQPQVEQNPVDLRDVKFVEYLGQLGITGLSQGDARVGGQQVRRSREHLGIAIETDEFSGGTNMFEEGAAMSAAADRTVDDDQSRLEVEELNDFPYDDGSMD